MQAIDQQQPGQASSWRAFLFIQRAVKGLVNFGVAEDMPHLERIRTRIFNHATIIVFVGSMIDAIESLIHQERGAVIILIFALSPLVALYLSHRGQNVAARLYLTAFIPSFVFLFFPLFGGSLSLCFTYFAFMIAILIGYEDKRILWLNLLFVLGLFLISLTYTFAGDGIFRETTDHIDTIINVSVTMLIISLGIFQFLRGLIIQEKLLNAQKLELESKNADLERILQQNEIKTELLAMVARDIKKPAQSFKASARRMLDLLEKNNPFEVLSLATKMEKTGESLFFHLDHLIKWVLAQNDQLEVTSSRFDAEETTMMIVKNLNYLTVEKQVTISFEPFEQPFIHSDKDMFSIIMQHIIHNILHLPMPDGQIRIGQIISPGEYGIRASIIGRHANQELFEKFQKGLTSKPSGRNLSRPYSFQISLFLADLLGGRIKVERDEGQQIDLTLYLPNNE